MAFPVPVIPVRADQPVRRAVRRLRWFQSTFREQVGAISRQTGVMFRVDEGALAACFVDWLRAFDQQKPNDPGQRRNYVGFAAGLMLQSLIGHKPLSVEHIPEGADLSNPAFFWPEGYAFVAYCLNIRSAVLEQDFDEQRDLAPELGQIRVWWSFKENSEQDSALAIAFLDLFSGDDPNWHRPGLFSDRQVQALAPRFYARRALPER